MVGEGGFVFRQKKKKTNLATQASAAAAVSSSSLSRSLQNQMSRFTSRFLEVPLWEIVLWPLHPFPNKQDTIEECVTVKADITGSVSPVMS